MRSDLAPLEVPLFDLRLSEADKSAVRATLDDGWLAMGRRTESFEHALADATGAREAVAVNSGTAALHLSLQALGVGAGDEVICPSLTFVATANAARYVGATVVFCESRGDGNLNLDPDDVERRITPRTRAVLAVHYAGYPADLPRLADVCDRHGVMLIEDASHACISTLRGRACGTWGVSGCFSFFSNKNLTCGEGGAIITDDERLGSEARRLRSHGMSTTVLARHHGHADSYDVVGLGYNYRLDEMRASLALTQLGRIGEFLDQRQSIVERYTERLRGLPVDIPDFDWPNLATSTDRVAHHIYPILLPAEANRARVRQLMRERGVQTSVHYPPVHRLTSFTADGPSPSLPRTEALAARELTLPLFPTMTSAQQDLVCESLCRALEQPDPGLEE